MKDVRYLFFAIIFFIAFTLVLTGCKAGDGKSESGVTHTGVDNRKTETGDTQQKEVPFSSESMEEIRKRESEQPPDKKQRVIPIQKAPPPVELPKPDETAEE